ncbi:MAG: N-acetyltransferase [Rhodobiaceae bacterium]|nr:N-acetyltransferase [Rhodobiaceae bacterium]
MGEFDDSVTLSVHPAIAEIGKTAWNACAAGLDKENPETPSNPFVSFEFLNALEETECVGPHTGWHPAHLALREGAEVVGCVPAYVKSHSQGEYVFDYGWADAFERAGGRYYPKLQVSVPFTPATGPRLLIRAGQDESFTRARLAEGLTAACGQLDASSVHATFLTAEDAATFDERGYLHREDIQYHWFNDGFAAFDGFLDTLASRKRKAIRRERRQAAENGISFKHLRGSEITEADWDAFFRFYMDTGSRKWGTPYLNRPFFSALGQAMGARVLLIIAVKDGAPVAGALNLIGGDALYGRYWGTLIDQPFLHFETCYYQAIDFAIAHGLSRVEAGAQGPHKLARGYRPVITHSAHWIRHQGLRRAVADYLRSERPAIEREADSLAQHLPFRRG